MHDVQVKLHNFLTHPQCDSKEKGVQGVLTKIFIYQQEHALEYYNWSDSDARTYYSNSRVCLFMIINTTHKQSEKNLGKIGDMRTQSLAPELLTNPGCQNKYQMNVMAMYYDLKVSYKNDLIFNFMNFIGKNNNINWNEKVAKLNDKMTCISATKP